MTKRDLRFSLPALALGFIAGFAVASPWSEPPQPKGAYFCCDQEGKPCVLSPDGDCSTPVQWCSKTQTNPQTGETTCAEW